MLSSMGIGALTACAKVVVVLMAVVGTHTPCTHARHVFTSTHTRGHTHGNAHTHARIHTRMHTSIHTLKHTDIHTYMHKYIDT